MQSGRRSLCRAGGAGALVPESINQLLKATTAQKRKLAARIAAVLDGDPLWKEPDQAFRSVKELADCSRKLRRERKAPSRRS
jgi:hypothetical protein